MASLYQYTVEDKDGHDQSMVWEQHELEDAKAYAIANKLRLIEQEYEWSDSSMIEDYTDKEPCSECGRAVEDCNGGMCVDCSVTMEESSHKA